jgi:hypothetical protein
MAAPAVLRTLEEVWKALLPLQIPMAVMGGLALSVWKRPRATRDVDLLVGIGGRRPEELLSALTGAGFRAKHTPPVRPLGTLQIMQLEFEPKDSFVSISVDLLLVDSEYHREALRRSVSIRLENVADDIAVLSCEDLLIHKLMAGRSIDRADAAAVLRANRDLLDFGYLTRWATALRLTEELREIWREAYGDEAPQVV